MTIEIARSFIGAVFYPAMIRVYRLILFLVLVNFLTSQQSTSDFNQELQAQSKAVQALRDEINTTKMRIQSQARKEKSAARRVSNLAEEISLMERLLSELQKEERLLVADITRIKKRIAESEQSLDTLRTRYGRRVVRMYKRGTLSDLEKIFSSTSWRQAVYRVKYLQIISEIDTKTAKTIESLLAEIGQQKLSLEATLRKKRRLQRERKATLAELRRSKRKKQHELAKIRQSKKELTVYLNEKQAGVKQLEAIIKKIQEEKARAERAERIRRQQMALNTKEFARLKGQLAWPAQGRVITKFGRQWNPKLKTTTENPGIDIKGKPGSPIYSVLGGVVTTITFIRGYGTTIIVDHGGGFYTVYSHVTKVKTSVDSEVQAGDVIAYMGDSGSINGAQLHFEIWGRGQKLDPQKWLSQR
ncbi:MAG: murein hydrolase activator EnvC family protein [Fidelibacterota bacterium]